MFIPLVVFAYQAWLLIYAVGQFHINNFYDERKNELCSEISTFTPNLCDYPVALLYCRKECDINRQRTLHCGERNTSTLVRRKRIVGGIKSRPGDWPWHVSLRINETQWCSGSILSKHFILTAAHCFDAEYTSLNPDHWQVHAGDHHLSSIDVHEQVIGVNKIILHPDLSFSYYGKPGKVKFWAVVHNDIAILQLKQPVRLGEPDKTNLCIPDKRKTIPNGYGCNIVGWGHTSFEGIQPDELREAKVCRVPNKICNLNHVYNHTINSTQLFCAGFERGGIDACNYDSGGAMICEKQGRWYATGIISSGFECARPHSYGLYTNVEKYNQWIVDTILNVDSL